MSDIKAIKFSTVPMFTGCSAKPSGTETMFIQCVLQSEQSQRCHGMGLLLVLAGSVGIWSAGRLPLDSSVIPTCSLLFSLNTWKEKDAAILQ